MNSYNEPFRLSPRLRLCAECVRQGSAVADMIHKGLVVALGDNSDLAHSAVDHCGKLEVDQAVAATVWHGAHGANRGYLAEIAVKGV